MALGGNEISDQGANHFAVALKAQQMEEGKRANKVGYIITRQAGVEWGEHEMKRRLGAFPFLLREKGREKGEYYREME